MRDRVRRLKCVGPVASKPLRSLTLHCERLTRDARAGTDACTEACQRAVCVNTHQVRFAAFANAVAHQPCLASQVPAWNDQCLKRCTLECQRGRT